MTICHIPVPYPDESLYSYLIRIHDRSVSLRWTTTCRELFNQEIERYSPFLFRYFRALSENTGLPEDLLIQMSGAGFYLSFLDRPRQQAIRESILSGLDSRVSMRLVAKKNPTTAKHFLYYCPACAREDEAKYGIAYFHTVHQLEGVCACPVHACRIETYPVRKVVGTVPIHLERTDSDPLDADIKEVEIARLAEEVQKSPGILTREILTEKYLQEAEARNLLRRGGKIASGGISSVPSGVSTRLLHLGTVPAPPRANLLLWREWELHIGDFLNPGVLKCEKRDSGGQICPICSGTMRRLSVSAKGDRIKFTWHCDSCDLYANTYQNGDRIIIVQYGQKFLDNILLEWKAGKSIKKIAQDTPFGPSVIRRLLKTRNASPITEKLNELESGNSSYSTASIKKYTRLYDPNWQYPSVKDQSQVGTGKKKRDSEIREKELLEAAEKAYGRLCEGDFRISRAAICREAGLSYRTDYRTRYPRLYAFLKAHCDHGDDRKVRREKKMRKGCTDFPESMDVQT